MLEKKGGLTTQTNQENQMVYDGSLGVFINVGENIDRDTGDYKYQRRPLFEWLARWLRYVSNMYDLFEKVLQIHFLFKGLDNSQREIPCFDSQDKRKYFSSFYSCFYAFSR